MHRRNTAHCLIAAALVAIVTSYATPASAQSVEIIERLATAFKHTAETERALCRQLLDSAAGKSPVKETITAITLDVTNGKMKVETKYLIRPNNALEQLRVSSPKDKFVIILFVNPRGMYVARFDRRPDPKALTIQFWCERP